MPRHDATGPATSPCPGYAPSIPLRGCWPLPTLALLSTYRFLTALLGDDFIKFRKGFDPVYVVAAQGGGIYAAYHVAAFLAAIQDRCPTFSQHIFAISGVSGGSVGSAVCAGAVRTARPSQSNDACVAEDATLTPVLANTVDQILQPDFLSTVLSRALFPDLLRQLLPFPVPPFDKARRLESSLEHSSARLETIHLLIA